MIMDVSHTSIEYSFDFGDTSAYDKPCQNRQVFICNDFLKQFIINRIKKSFYNIDLNEIVRIVENVCRTITNFRNLFDIGTVSKKVVARILFCQNRIGIGSYILV